MPCQRRAWPCSIRPTRWASNLVSPGSRRARAILTWQIHTITTTRHPSSRHLRTRTATRRSQSLPSCQFKRVQRKAMFTTSPSLTMKTSLRPLPLPLHSPLRCRPRLLGLLAQAMRVGTAQSSYVRILDEPAPMPAPIRSHGSFLGNAHKVEVPALGASKSPVTTMLL